MEIKIHILDVDYVMEGGEAAVRIYGKTRDGSNVLGFVRDFEPYFYAVPRGDAAELAEEIASTRFHNDGEELELAGTETVERLVDNQEKEVLRLVARSPPDVPKLSSEVASLEGVEECREFDIPFYKRFLIDNQLSPVTPVVVTGEEVDADGFDTAVEVESVNTTGSGEDIRFETLAFDLEVYEDEIIMVSMFADGFEKVLTTREIDQDYVETLESEKQLVEEFIRTVDARDVDIVTGYNTDEFDFSVLRDRAEHHGLELSLGRGGERMKFRRRGRFSAARLKGRMHLDLYPFIAHVLSQGLESETLDLDSVAEELLGENKDEMSWEQMKRSWSQEEELERFAKYALRDSELAFRLADRLAPQILELSRLTGLIPFDACRLTYGQLTENYLLREAFDRGMLAPNRPSRNRRSNRERQGAYSGGFVYEPEAGLHDDLVLLDFRSLYPTVMVSHNISPDTLNRESCDNRFRLEEFGYDFCQDSQGFFPELVERLVEDRYELKRELENHEPGTVEHSTIYSRQQAEKILANSFYGYLGYSGARWYSRECAEATTYLGRKYIQDAIQTAESEGFEVVYGDTDSLFLRKQDIMDEINPFLERVNRELPEFMELEFEGFFPKGFFTSTDSGRGAKKKYALLDPEGSLKITGFEYVRRDWSPIAKETQEQVLRKVLEDDVEAAAEIVKRNVEKLRAGEVPVEKLRIYTRLTKKPENYKSTAPHVEAAKRAIARGKDISPGETVEYVITRGGGSISSRAELPDHAEDYDPDYYIDNQVIPVALRVLKVFDYTSDQLKGKGRQSGLGRFG